MDNAHRLRNYDDNGQLGQLTNLDETQREQLFRAWIKELELQLAEATPPALIDASKLHGVNGGEQIRLGTDGRRNRESASFPEAEARMLDEPRPPARRVAGAPDLAALWMRAAYNGLWAPSGTNWQPIRSMALSADETQRISDGRLTGPSLAVLGLAHYSSILGDIAGLCGWAEHSRVEWVDLGIWLAFAQTTAQGHGWNFEELHLTCETRPAAENHLVQILKTRKSTLSGRSSHTAQAMLSALQAHDLRMACLLSAQTGPDLPLNEKALGGIQPSDCDRLVEARVSQRVASPAGEMERGSIEELWHQVRPTEGLALEEFTWHEEFSREVGQAMHAGLEGEAGLVPRIEIEQFRRSWHRWSDLDEAQLPAAALPQHLRKRLIEGGLYRQVDGMLLDHRDKPVTAERLIKLVRRITQNFGRYFLRFHNTHPLLGLILSPIAGPEDTLQRHWLEAGRAVGKMSLLARARGQVSIIKSGPLEIARKAIAVLLTQHARNESLRWAIKAAEMEPLLTFQLGLPLGPDELVSAGQPDEHTGLVERQLDRRAGRASLSEHYLPLPE